MRVLEHWNRLVDYLERMGAPRLFRYPKNTTLQPSSTMVPEGYLEFTEYYGYPTLYIDEDICLGFLSPEYAMNHPLYEQGVYPFAICSPDCQISVAFERFEHGFVVVAFDGLERIDIEGEFTDWMASQVRQFLLQLMHYNPVLLNNRQFSLARDPLNIFSSAVKSKIS